MIGKFYRLYISKYKKFNRKLFWTFGIVPKKSTLYVEAFTHNSLKHKHKHSKNPLSNERLEYLGDAVLDMVIAEVLYKKYPFRDEGFLTEMRSKIVSRNQLAVLGKRIGIQPFIRHSNNVHVNARTASIMIGNGFEAFIGALYLDQGYEKTRQFIIKRIVDRFIDFNELEETEISYKSRLYKWLQQSKSELKIDHKKIEEEGKSIVHHIKVLIDGNEKAQAKHLSKKKAIEQACQRVCEEMDI